MKKQTTTIFSTFIAFAMVLFMSTAYSQKPVDMISAWGEGGISYAMLSNLHDYDGQTFNSGIDVLGNCAAVGRYLENTDKPTISLTEAFILQDDGHPCQVINEDMFISVAGLSYWNFCRNPSDTDGLDDILRGNAKVGYFHGDDKRIPLEEILAGMGSNATTVPYETAPAYRAGLESGEVDYLFTTMTEGYECVLTTNPNETEIEYRVSDYYDGTFSKAAYGVALVGVNVDKEEVKRIFIESTDPKNSDMFTTGFARSYDPEFMKLDTEEQLSFVRNYIDTINELRNQ